MRSGETAGAGALVISLDFELYWGVRDRRSLSDRRRVLLGTRAVIPRILELFRQHHVHATWATVGLVFCRSRAEALAAAPTLRPSYANERLSPYPYLADMSDGDTDLHFAPDLVRLVAETPHQEVATHTFSHYYCLEPGQTVEQFRADLEAAQRVAEATLGTRVSSLVFPRNQVNRTYLRACADAGISTYRGTVERWYLRAQRGTGAVLARRLARMTDTYLPMSGSNTYVPRRRADEPLDLPSSALLRPYSPRLRALDAVKLRRLAGALEVAARRRRVFHLWWHPENFGSHPAENLEFLERFLDRFQELRRQHGLRSLSMAELAESAALPPSHRPFS